jgi:DNA-binding CsgD family transcriptional regulator
LAAAAPVLVAVDDLQWLDAASRAALVHALRRIDSARVGLLAASRPSAASPPLELDGIQVLKLERLSLAAVHELLKQRLHFALPRPLLVRVYETSRGNPLYALEIGRELLERPVGAAEPLPVPPDLRRLVRRRLSRLSRPARELLLVAASLDDPSYGLLASVLEGDASEALDEAERAEVVELDGDVVRFSHPLYAAAIYSAAPRERRRLVHGRLADAVEELEARARHLALATSAPSEPVAAIVERAGEQARARGATSAAAELYGRAAELTPPENVDGTFRRRFAAAQALFDGADGSAARTILVRLVDGSPSGPDRARALLLLGLIHSYDGEHAAATEACRQAIEDARVEPMLVAEAHLHYALVCYDDALAARQSVAAARVLVEAEPEAPADLTAAVLLDDAYQGLYVGEGLPLEQVERAKALVPASGETWPAQRAQVLVWLWAKYTDDLYGARDLLYELRDLRVEEGNDYEATHALRHLAEIECWLGNWPRARELAAEADEVATGRAVTLYDRALVAAHLGEVAEARECAQAGLVLSGDNPWDGALNLSVLGFLELSLDNAADAAAHLDAAAELVAQIGMAEPVRFRLDGDRLEALIALNRLEDAEALVRELGRRATATPRPWNCVMYPRADALLRAASGDLGGALTAVDRALEEHARLPMPFELGRTLLVKGQIERRAKRKAAAKASLSRALTIFDELGAPLWAEKARRELSRVGLRTSNRDELTETERQVAELAASGLKNREVAAKLFLSPKTVDANLARVYRKLGIRSRAELGARLAAVDTSPAAAQSANGPDALGR